MNREQRRRAARAARTSGNSQNANLAKRKTFEEDLRRALDLEGIKLVSCDVGVDEKTKESQWVLCLHDGQGFVYVHSSRAPLGDLAAGVTRTVREARANPGKQIRNEVEPMVPLATAPVPVPSVGLVAGTPAATAVPLTFEERLRAAELARTEGR